MHDLLGPCWLHFDLVRSDCRASQPVAAAFATQHRPHTSFQSPVRCERVVDYSKLSAAGLSTNLRSQALALVSLQTADPLIIATVQDCQWSPRAFLWPATTTARRHSSAVLGRLVDFRPAPCLTIGSLKGSTDKASRSQYSESRAPGCRQSTLAIVVSVKVPLVLRVTAAFLIR